MLPIYLRKETIMKIVKHNFEIQKGLEINGDEIVENSEIVELSFSLPLSALGLFEEEYGKPLVDLIVASLNSKDDNSTFNQVDFTRALACCMYLKIDSGKVINDQTSKEEFKNMDIYKSVASDLVLRTKLVQCAIDCINDNMSKTQNASGKPKK